jgi:exopolysaccharide biosynthesis polyprenyl glycosylphosphotransferase
MRLRRRRRERVLIVGMSPLALKLVEALQARPERWAVLGIVDDGCAVEALPVRVPFLGSLDGLGRVLREQRPDRVALALTARRGRLPLQLLLKSRFRGTVIEDGLELYERLFGKLAIEALTPSVLIFSREFRKSPLQQGFNRALSVAVAALSLVALAPLLLAISLLIVLDSAGPVFFLQDRVGLAGRRFRLIKFRTMLPARGAASEWERDNGARITRLGRWLRRFRLDELPQFLNILWGDMNLVGPRPHPVTNQDLFNRAIPYCWIRSTVMPGITGWAQVRYGYANGLEEETEKMRYDMYYVKHMSLLLDLRILFETVKVVLLGRDASSARRPSRPAKVVPITARTAARRKHEAKPLSAEPWGLRRA